MEDVWVVLGASNAWVEPSELQHLVAKLTLYFCSQLCRDCFYKCLEDEVHQTIVSNKLFKPGERVAVAASGGKDSTVLAHMLTLLNERHK